MIPLSIIPRTRRQHLRNHSPLSRKPLFLDFPGHFLRHVLLLVIMIPNRRPILTPHIWPLAIMRRRIMHPEEKLQQLLIAHFFRVETDLACFGVAGAAAADVAVGGCVGAGADSACVADAGVEEAFVGEVVAVHVFGAPEAARGYGAELTALGGSGAAVWREGGLRRGVRVEA